MRKTSSETVYDWLMSRIGEMNHGDRLPTVRDLMQKHGVGQGSVQAAFARLKDRGLISAQVGRGSYVVKTSRTEPRPETSAELRSLLILSNASMNERGTRVQNRIVDDVRGQGGRVVQLSYHDGGHLMEVLQSIPSFDAAILQSYFDVIPLRLLALLQQKTRALVVDGHSIAGLDVDHVGIDWEEALVAAMDHLTGLGHRRVQLVSLDAPAQPLVHARRYFSRLRDWRGTPLSLGSVTLRDLRHPSQPVASGLAAAMDEIRRRAPTALIFLGVSDALGIRDTLAEAGIAVPDDLSVVILGHPDVPTEHLGQFAVYGGSHAEAARQLLRIIRRRLADPAGPPEVHYLEIGVASGTSTAPPKG